MKQIILLIILILIVLYINNYEFFSDIVSDNIYTNNYETYKKSEEYISELSYEKYPNRKCCLVEKKYIPNENNKYGGDFSYIFKELENENCDLKLFRLDSNKQLFFEGENNWSNDNCNPENKIIGSCRFVNKECIDFVTKDYCDKYNMTWSDKTCHNQLDFQWVDKISRIEIPTIDKTNLIITNEKDSVSLQPRNKIDYESTSETITTESEN